MQHFLKSMLILACLCFLNNHAYANPWFTGPILAPSGHTVPRGHTNFEYYGLDVRSDGFYNQSGRFIHTPFYTSYVSNPIMTHGFTDWLDIQLVIPYVFNETQDTARNRLADISMSAGIQLLEQKTSLWKPDVRLLIQQVFPTGRFERLDPLALGTDATGSGSNETQVGLNFQLLSPIYDSHYLRTRLILSHLFTSPVNVHGLNSYGGTPTTNGTIKAGEENTVDLAFEYTLTQNWVAVMEGYITHGNETRFDGIIEIGDIGNPTTNILNGKFSQTGLAPAIEYNFSPTMGLIGGVWFPVAGKNTAHFVTYVLALNVYW